MEAGGLRDLVVGVDGSGEAALALRWAVEAVASGGRVHAVSVADEHGPPRRPEATAATVEPVVVEGADVDRALLDVAADRHADAIVVGHRPQARLGMQVVGHVTAGLIHASPVPVVVVPEGWDAARDARSPIVVGVGVSAATRPAVAWAMRRAEDTGCELHLVHALGPRSWFRPDGLLDLLAYHIDPAMRSAWIAEDIDALAEEIREQTGRAVAASVSVEHGPTGHRLVEAGQRASLLVIGRGEPAFVKRRVMAPYLRHAILNATCPVAVVPPPAAP